MISNLIEKLKDPEYRKAFVASQINIGIPFQIRGLLKSRNGWTQATLAEKAGMLQPRISGLMTPGRVRPNIETLRRIAEAFDCGLVVRFAPFSELVRWSEWFSPDEFTVPSFGDDAGLVENMQPVAASSMHNSISTVAGRAEDLFAADNVIEFPATKISQLAETSISGAQVAAAG